MASRQPEKPARKRSSRHKHSESKSGQKPGPKPGGSKHWAWEECKLNDRPRSTPLQFYVGGSEAHGEFYHPTARAQKHQTSARPGDRITISDLSYSNRETVYLVRDCRTDSLFVHAHVLTLLASVVCGAVWKSGQGSTIQAGNQWQMDPHHTEAHLTPQQRPASRHVIVEARECKAAARPRESVSVLACCSTDFTEGS